MIYRKKIRLADEGKKVVHSDSYVERQAQKASGWVQNLPRVWFLMLLTGLFFGLFMMFKWWNRGGVNLVSSGDNVINMVILLVLFGLLDNFWDFNGEESMGWGSM